MNRWELPEGWEWTTLGDKFSIEVGATPSRKRPDFWGGSIPWVSSGEVQFCRIASTNEQITDAGLRNTSTKVHPKGTVLLGMIGQGRTRGQAAILDVEACNNQNCAAIRVSEAGGVPEYVYNWLYYQYESTRNVGSGNIQQALNKSRVSDISIPLPPPEEQTRIVSRLSALQARITTARAGLDDLRQLATALKRAVLDAAFRGDLTATWREAHPDTEPASALLDRLRAERRRRWQEAHPKKPYIAPEPVDPTDLPELPEEWCWAALEEVSDNHDGRRKPITAKDRVSGGYPYYGASGIVDQVDGYLFDGDYLLVSEDGANLLARSSSIAFRASGRFWVNNHAHVLTPASGVNIDFLTHAVEARDLMGSITGSAQPKLTQAALNRLPLPLPPTREQAEIASLVTSTWSTANSTLDAVQALTDDLTTTEHALLTAAFRGDLLPPVTP